MTIKKSDDQEPEHPALFATIHHRSDERPDGYTHEDIAELNRAANAGRHSNKRRNIWIAVGTGVTLLVLAGTPWALMAWDNIEAEPAVPTVDMNVAAPDVPSVAPPPEDYPAASYLEVRGLHIGQSRDEVLFNTENRGMIAVENGGSPLMEMHFGLPSHESGMTLYPATPECSEELDRRDAMTPDEKNSLAAMQMNACKLAGRVLFDADGNVEAFYLTPRGFEIEQISLQDFAQAVVDNHGIDSLKPEQQRLRTLGFDGYCTNMRGVGLADVRVNVSDCGFMRVQVERSSTSAANFS